MKWPVLFWFSLVPRPSQYSNGRWQRLESCWILSHDTHLMFIFTALFMGSNVDGRKWYFFNLSSPVPLFYTICPPLPFTTPDRKKGWNICHFICFCPGPWQLGWCTQARKDQRIMRRHCSMSNQIVMIKYSTLYSQANPMTEMLWKV